MQVVIHGRVRAYEPQGIYQLHADEITPAGAGDLHAQYEGEVLGVDLPVTVDLRVTQTDPGFAGDTATGAKKAATLETGLVVQVPLFINEGDLLRVDTRTGDYVTRVQ
jgi:hypothetical protein